MADPADNVQTAVVADIDLKQIICALHNKAIQEAVKDKQYKIQNTAIDIDGDNDKTAKFYGAGTHMIAAIPANVKEGEVGSIPKTKALEMLQAYVQWYSGPDMAKKITSDKLIALEDEQTQKTEMPKESCVSINIPSFKTWLLTEEGETEDTGTETEDDDSKDDGTETDEETDDIEEESAPGYYINYKLKVEGQPEVSTGKILKKAAGDWIKNIGLVKWDWRTGAESAAVKVGDIVDELSKVFGKIDPDELNATYNANLKKKFPKGDAIADVWDTPTILQYLKKQMTSADAKKVSDAEYAICTRVNKNDKSYKLYKPSVIADLITSSIKGIVKVFKNRIEPENVILVNNYSDNKKEDGEDKKYIDKDVGTVNDSKIIQDKQSIVVEDADSDSTSKKSNSVEDVQKKLNELASDKLASYAPITLADTSNRVIEHLKALGLDEPQLYSELQDAEHSFLIQLKQPKLNNTETATENQSYIAANELIKLIFEAKFDNNDQKILETVKKCFMNFVMSYKSYDKDGKEVNPDTAFIDKISGYILDKNNEAPKLPTAESFENAKTLFKNIYDYDILNEDIEIISSHLCKDKQRVDEDTLITEKNHKTVDDKKLQLLKKLIAAKLDIIRDNKDKIIKDAYTECTPLDADPWVNPSSKNGYDDFINTIFGTDDADAVNKKLNKICHRENFVNDVVYRFINATKWLNHEDEEAIKEEPKKIKITFYDSDPKTGKKLDKPLGDPIEIDAGIKLDTSEEVRDIQAKYTSQLSDDKKDGYTFNGWSPETSTTADENTDIVAKYVEDDKKDTDEEKTIDVFYVIPDNTGILKSVESKSNKNEVKANHTDFDFYIVPMKGLNRQDKKQSGEN